MEKLRRPIEIAVFIISAVITFYVFKAGSTFSKVVCSAVVGFVFELVCEGFLKAFDDDYKKNTNTANKIILIISTLGIPVLFLIMFSKYKISYHADIAKTISAFLVAGIPFIVIALIIKFIFKMFDK